MNEYTLSPISLCCYPSYGHVIIFAVKVSELGEFGLVNLLAQMISRSRNEQFDSWRQLIIGIGDDAAAWYGDNSIQLAHVDSLFQDVHFTFSTTPWRELGWKSLAVTVSDIAAMGGIPKYALVSLTLLGDNEVEDVKSFCEGMIELANRFGIAIIGGDTSRASVVSVTVTVLGSMKDRNRENLLTRSAAKPGDKIAVTGYLGGAAGGLAMLTNKLRFDAASSDQLRKAFLCPLPRVTEGQLLVAQGVRAAMDISDGLISDLTHLCEASQVSAWVEVNRVPVHPAVKANFGDRALDLALSGGEDYELLFTASDAVIAKVKKALSCPVTAIGEIGAEKPPKVALVDASGKPFPLRRAGWEHFKPR